MGGERSDPNQLGSLGLRCEPGLDTSTCTSTCSLKCYFYLYLDKKYLKNTKYIQVQTSTLYLIKSCILYIDCIEVYVDTIG